MSLRAIILSVCSGALAWLGPAVAHAGQPHDWPLRPQEPGWGLMADVFTGGAQLGLEHRLPIYGGANELTSRLNLLGSVPYGDAALSVDLRMLFLSLGVQAGVRGEWESYNFDPEVIAAKSDTGERFVRKYCPTQRDPNAPSGRAPTGESCESTRAARIKMVHRDLTDGLALVPYMELRAQLFAPINEYVVLLSLVGAERQIRDDNTWDQAYSVRHDAGWMLRWETQLYVKHRDVGAIGWYSRLVHVPQGADFRTELSYGFLAVRRLGLLRRNDAIALWAMFQPGSREYGIQQFHAPIWGILAYRVLLDL